MGLYSGGLIIGTIFACEILGEGLIIGILQYLLTVTEFIMVVDKIILEYKPL